MITTKQGPLLQGEWRHRLVNGAYTIRALGHLPARQGRFPQDGIATPGYREWRGSVETTGQFNLSEKWVWGWDGTLLSDKTYLQDYGLNKSVQSSNLLRWTPDYALSQLYHRGSRRSQLFRCPHALLLRLLAVGRSEADPDHPPRASIIEYIFKDPIFGGELALRSNVTSLSRDTANFDPISRAAVTGGLCNPTTADPAVKNSTNCLLRGVPGNYTRALQRGDLAAHAHRLLGPDVHSIRHRCAPTPPTMNVADPAGRLQLYQCRPDAMSGA